MSKCRNLSKRGEKQKNKNKLRGGLGIINVGMKTLSDGAGNDEKYYQYAR